MLKLIFFLKDTLRPPLLFNVGWQRDKHPAKGSLKYGWISLSAEKAANNLLRGESYCVCDHQDHVRQRPGIYVDALTLLSSIFVVNGGRPACFTWQKV